MPAAATPKPAPRQSGNRRTRWNDTSADLRQGVRNRAHRFGLPAFWSWWTGELARAFPARRAPRCSAGACARCSRSLPGRRGALGARASRRALELVETGAGFLSAATRQPSPRPATPRSSGLARKAYGGSVAATRLRVALPPSQVLRKTLVLPAAVEENLRQAIA